MLTRRALLALAVSLLPALPGAAGPAPLSEISAYIGTITTIRAPFVQINADGSVATGRIAIQRPARARLDYDDASGPLIIAAAGQIAIFDGASREPPSVYPTSKTPLALILDRRVDIATSPIVVGHYQDGDATIVALRDPEVPDMGTVELAFTGAPLRLLGWSVIGDAGERVDVYLEEHEIGVAIPPSTFSIDNEMRARGLVKDD
ncbi:MAG: LolA family protein [Gemmobacter sp.]